MIEKSICAAHTRMKEKHWDKIYILVDIHNTIFRPSYHKKETYEWFEMAKEALQFMSRCDKICLILWTSSYGEVIDEYLKVFEGSNIHFDYINENPEVENNDLGCFDNKLYFNVGIDDKFGFDAEGGDWKMVYDRLNHFFPEKTEKMDNCYKLTPANW